MDIFEHIGSLLSANIGIVLIFTIIYMIYLKEVSNNPNEEFNSLNSDSSFIDILYFTFTVQSTVGFGDISPKSQVAKVLVMLQQLTLIVNLDLIKDFFTTSTKKKF